MEQDNLSFIPINTPIQNVNFRKAFQDLTIKEKLYAYYFSRASWAGQKICYFQKSYESPALFYLFYRIFQEETPEEIRTKLINSGFTQVEVQQLIIYIGSVFENSGNFISFGDRKFIPEIPKERFLAFIKLTKGYSQYQEKFDYIWEHVNHELYVYVNPYRIINFTSNQGQTAYYSSNVTQQNAEQIGRFMEQESISLSPLNTRLLKHSETDYEILVASISKELETSTIHEFEGLKIKITYGDFSVFIQQLYSYLENCIKYAENNHQVEMINAYLRHFKSGSIEEHKTSQRHWIKDKGPVIETNIGFVESYLDPLKVRAEFEGFVAIVNKQESKKFEELVEKAEKFLTFLPWPREFETDKFTRPDFTSLEVLTFACSFIPWGINIPNYDDIRQNEGFKNVNLGNVYSTPEKEHLLFTPDEATKELYCKYFKDSIFVLVGLHELLGHGSGKNFTKNKDGVFNFDKENLIHPIFKTKIETFYDVNETWNSKFGEISSIYEECRAQAVGIYLSCFQECLDVLIPQFSKKEQEDIVYILWFEICFGSTVKGLQYYDTELSQWGQSHIAADFALTKLILEKGEGMLRFEKCEREGKPYVTVHLDRSKIQTVGKEIVKNFLFELQVYKSTGDSVRGTEFMNKYLSVDNDMLEIRKIVTNYKIPDKSNLQEDLILIGNDENVEVKQFELSFDGLISSNIFHHQEPIDEVYNEWLKNSKLFRINQTQTESK